MKAIFYNRSYEPMPQDLTRDTIIVDRFSRNIIGGPETMDASAPLTVDKWALFNLLRAPVEVYDDSELVWWGYVSKITIPDGAVKFSLGVNGMYNSIAVLLLVLIRLALCILLCPLLRRQLLMLYVLPFKFRDCLSVMRVAVRVIRKLSVLILALFPRHDILGGF